MSRRRVVVFTTRRSPRPATAAVQAKHRPLDVRLLIASGAIEARPTPSLWRGLVAWLLQPSPFGRSSFARSTAFAPTTVQELLP